MAMAPTVSDSLPALSSNPVSRSRTPTLRNPLPLSSAQEAQVRDLYYKKVRSKCADEIKEFALCAKGRTVSTSWTCRAQRFAMNSCMIAHATQENEDAAREEWFAGVDDRRRKREEETVQVEKRRTEVIELTRRQEEKERLQKEQEELIRTREKDTRTIEENPVKQKRTWWG